MQGNSLSVLDTVFVTNLLCDAYEYMNTGRVQQAKDLIEHSLVMLPDNGSKTQAEAISSWQLGFPKKGFNPR